MAWLYVITGFAKSYLTHRPAFLAEAYPLYLPDRTGLATWVLKSRAPPAGLVLAPATFGTTANPKFHQAAILRSSLKTDPSDHARILR